MRVPLLPPSTVFVVQYVAARSWRGKRDELMRAVSGCSILAETFLADLEGVVNHYSGG